MILRMSKSVRVIANVLECIEIADVSMVDSGVEISYGARQKFLGARALRARVHHRMDASNMRLSGQT